MDISDVTKDFDYLEHYGVKGMRWGVVKSRGPSGGGVAQKEVAQKEVPGKPSTIAERRANKKAKIASATKELPAKEHVDKSEVQFKAKHAGTRTLSNDDLQSAIRRMELEQRFVLLSQKENPPSWVTNFIKTTGKRKAEAALTSAVSTAIDKAIAEGTKSLAGTGAAQRR
jgi:hypothetical protein